MKSSTGRIKAQQRRTGARWFASTPRRSLTQLKTAFQWKGCIQTAARRHKSGARLRLKRIQHRTRPHKRFSILLCGLLFSLMRAGRNSLSSENPRRKTAGAFFTLLPVVRFCAMVTVHPLRCGDGASFPASRWRTKNTFAAVRPLATDGLEGILPSGRGQPCDARIASMSFGGMGLGFL